MELFNRLDTDETKTIVMTPRSETGGSYYAKRIKKISEEFNDLLPDGGQWIQFSYNALDYNIAAQEVEENEGYRGMALFRDDPDSDGQGTKGWRLFYEDVLYSDTV